MIVDLWQKSDIVRPFERKLEIALTTLPLCGCHTGARNAPRMLRASGRLPPAARSPGPSAAIFQILVRQNSRTRAQICKFHR